MAEPSMKDHIAALEAKIDALVGRFEDSESRNIEFMKLMTATMEVLKTSRGGAADRNPAYSLYLRYDKARKEALAAGVAPDPEKMMYPGVVINIRNTSPDDQPVVVRDENGKVVQTAVPHYPVHMTPPAKIDPDLFVIHRNNEDHGPRRTRKELEDVIEAFEQATAKMKASSDVSLFSGATTKPEEAITLV